MLLEEFPWSFYSQKFIDYILSHKAAGKIERTSGDSEILATASGGRVEEGACISWYILAKKSSGILCEVKFQAYGETPLIGSAQAIAACSLGKTYMQAQRIGVDMVRAEVEDKKNKKGLPYEVISHVYFALDIFHVALSSFPEFLAQNSVLHTPLNSDRLQKEEHPHWNQLSMEEKEKILQDLVDVEVLPYIQLDGGGVKVKSVEKNIIIIQYEGACVTCSSSTGSTLMAIQEIFRRRIHPDIRVVPYNEKQLIF